MDNRNEGTPPADAGADGPIDPHRLARSVYGVARGHGTFSLRFLDAGVVMSAWILAYYAGFSGRVPFTTRSWLAFLLLPLITQLLCNQFAGLYGPVWRYASVEEAGRVVVAVVAGAAITAMELAWVEAIHSTTMPLFSAPPIAAFLMLIGCGGIRFQARLFALERQRTGEEGRLRTLIVGATDEGLNLALEVGRRAFADGVIIGFVDDQRTLVGRSLAGTRVLGTPDDLVEICARERIDRILVALPDAPRDRVREIVNRALTTEAQVKMLPTEVSEGGSLLASLRDLDLTDLLGREHSPVDTTDIAHYLTGAVVLVTGAGGSIGSEIARQVNRFGPARLLLLDRDESLLFESTMRIPDAVPLLADITDAKRLREIFTEHEPDVVFHAAAHKHVPILESHAAEAVRNNVLATLTLAREAARSRCRLVHISTDKAADPCSVMGATKRAAELVVLAVGTEHGLPFSAVRFGNVLGSRGSVVPTFFGQILDGGPVTVTDPEMTRFFMTIPEAVSLVLQAGSMAEGRKVFLLEMGSPVRILDLAHQMIRLAGLRPGEDIEIAVVGARPGERTHERLHDDGEIIGPTDHPAIRGLTPRQTLDLPAIHSSLELLSHQCDIGDDHAAVLLLDAMLRDAGVPCHLEENMQVAIDALTAPAGDELGPDADSEEHPPLMPLARDRRPAVLGGGAAFPRPLPFVRPPRPVLDRVMSRLAPSYDRGLLTNGPLVAELEERAAERLGTARAVAVSSCTSGLMLVIQAVTDGARNGRVLVPGFTFSASAHAVAWNGLDPRFVECTPDGFQMDPDAVAALVGADDVRAVLATHVFGAPCAPDRIIAAVGRPDVPVVFDAAHAFGAVAAGRRVGGFGAAEVFSLTPTKVLVAGEGGIVATDDTALADTIRIGRDYGNPGDYDTRFVGLNARMSEFHAAMALTSLDALDEHLERRRDIADRYRSALAGVPGIGFQVVDPADVSTYKDFTITVDAGAFGCSRDVLARALAADGIDTRKYFSPPVHRQRAYAALTPVDLPITDSVAARVLSLPIFPDLGDEDLERVAAAIAAIGAHGAAVTARLVGTDPAQPVTIDRD